MDVSASVYSSPERGRKGHHPFKGSAKELYGRTAEQCYVHRNVKYGASHDYAVKLHQIFTNCYIVDGTTNDINAYLKAAKTPYHFKRNAPG